MGAGSASPAKAREQREAGEAAGQWETPLIASLSRGQRSPTFEQPPAALGSTGPALAPAPHQGVTETYRMRISFHSSSELPICFPVFLVSLGSPSPATST